MSTLFNKAFWMDAMERAAKTIAQTLIAALGLGSAGADVLHTDWQTSLGLALSAGLLSVLTSIISAQTTNNTRSGSLLLQPGMQPGIAVQPTAMK